MADVATQVPVQNQDAAVQTADQSNQQPDFNQQLAQSLWNGVPMKQPEPAGNPPQTTSTPDTTTQTVSEEVQTIDLDEYFKREFGTDAAAAKAEWANLQKLKETPPTPQEIQWANDDSKKVFESLKSGDTKPLYEYLQRQSELEQAANLSAADAIKLHIKLNNPHYKAEDIADVFEEKYALPTTPTQEQDEDDTAFQARMNQYNQSVEKINRRIERDAFSAKEGLSQLKSQLVLPDIPQVQNAEPQPDQKELEPKQQVFMDNFKKALDSNYQNFKGFNVTAIDGEVQLPISYVISPEEVNASKQELENFNVNEFLDQRWFDEKGNPNITLMQEDLYLLKNRDKVLQKVANEAAAQRYLHHQKVQNNININGVNNQIAPTQQPVKSESEVLAENIWKM